MNRRSALESLALGVPAWWGLSRSAVLAGGPEGKEAKKEAKDEGKKEDKKDVPAAEEEEIPLAKVPDKVRKAADAAAPRVKWESACRRKEEGETTWELEGADAKGREVIVTLTPDGEVVEIETEIPPREVPDVVREAVKAKWPHFKMSAAFEVRKDGKIVSYDLEGKRPKDKHDIGISVSADGTEVELDEDK